MKKSIITSIYKLATGIKLFFLFCLLIQAKSNAQTTFFNDSCNTATGWTLGLTAPNGSNQYIAWRISNISPYVIDGTALSINTYNKVVGSNAWTNDYLKTISANIIARKQVDARNYQTLTLKFDWICKGENSGTTAIDYGQIGYSTDGGTTFTWLTTGGPASNGNYYGSTAIVRNQTITLPTALNRTQFVLGFRWINNSTSGLDPGFIVDNIRVSGTSVGTLLPAQPAFFVDNFRSDAGWVLENAAATQTPTDYTAWRINSGDSLCNIDSGSLAINHWNKAQSHVWSCGYVDNLPADIKAYKKVDAKAYENMQLQFDWNCPGEYSGSNIYDYGQVGYSTDGSNFTWINTGGTNGLGQFYGSAAIVRNQTITLPSTLNGKEFWLGFRWYNDYSVEHDPGFVISNIRISGRNIGKQLTSVFKDNFDSESSWKLKKGNVDPSGKTLAWSIDNRCGIDGNSLSLKLYDNTLKEWVCGFATNAATDIIASRSITTNYATNLFVKMDWKVTSTSATDYGQLGYSTDGGTTFTWLPYGGVNNTGKYYNQPTTVKSAMIKLPPSLEGQDFVLGFRWINDASSNTGQAITIDNLSVVGVPAPAVAAAPSEVEKQKVSRVTEELLQVAGKKTDADVDVLTETGKIMKKTYYDGENRVIQDIYVKAAPSKNDIIETKLYDENGISALKILPYKGTTTDGGFHTNMLNEQFDYYYAVSGKANFTATAYPYIQVITDKSPVSNITEKGSVGKDFQPDPLNASVTRTIVYKQYTAIDNNPPTPAEAIKYITIVPGTTDLKVDYYSAANGLTELFVKETTDEDKKITRNYINDKDQIILVRKYAVNGTTILTQTYYVYDDMDKLRFIIQPEGMEKITIIPQTLNNSIKDYCFEYNYDSRGRLISKKIPGGGRTEIAYDRWDRPAISQDANQRAKNPQEFTYTKYDMQNRPIMTGTFIATNRTLTIDAVRAELLDPSLGNRFESRNMGTLPNSDYADISTYPRPNSTNYLEVLVQNYYDDNNYTDLAGFTFTPYLGYTAASVVKNVKGLVTATKTKVLGTTNTWIMSVSFYDQYDNIIQVQKQNINGVKSFITTTYDFMRRAITTIEDSKLTTTIGAVSQTTNTYDHIGRLTRISQNVNSGSTVVIADYKYTDLGTKVKEKNMGSANSGSTYLQSVDYSYNEKGWLTHINNGDLSNDGIVSNDDANDLFGIDLNYYQDLKIDASKACYNGNLAEQIWKSTVSGDKKKGYLYTYDDLNRLTSANYRVYETNWTSSVENNRYSLNSITYFANGNINTLQQNGILGTNTYGLIDNLTYNYTGNQLMKVDDAVGATASSPYDFENGNTTVDYSYDANGNLTSDKNKGYTSITYNAINQIQQATVGSNKIIYTYDASGTKLRKQVYTGTTLTSTIDYWYSVQYTNSAIDFIYNAEGRVVNNAGTYKYEYFIRDHTGNVRLTFSANAGSGLAEINQRDDYYPLGNTFNSITPSKKNNYLFNSKEFQQELNLNVFDFGARMYDPQIGRTFQVDPYADQFASLSPFSFLNNNPNRFIDPTGMIAIDKKEDWEDGGDGGETNDNTTPITDNGGDKEVLDPGAPLPKMNASVVEVYSYVSTVYIYINNFYTGGGVNAPISNMEVSRGRTQGNRSATVEDVLRAAMAMKPGSQMSGDDIAKLNPKFSKAGAAIDNIKKLPDGRVQVNLTSMGKGVVYFSPDYSNIDGAIFNLSNYKNKDGMEVIHIQSPTAMFGDNPLNFYVNNNDFSLDGSRGIFFGSLFHK